MPNQRGNNMVTGEFPSGQLWRSPQLLAVAVLPESFDSATGFGSE